MEGIDFNKVEGDKVENKDNSRYKRLKRFLIASTVPIALLAAGCSESSNKSDFGTKDPKIEKILKDKREVENDVKILHDCLVRVAGGEASFDISEDGDYLVRVDGSKYYRLDDESAEKVLSVAKENMPWGSFEVAEEKFQTEAVRKAILDFGQLVNFDQLTPELKEAESVRQENPLTNSQELKPKSESSETKINPDIKDFL